MRQRIRSMLLALALALSLGAVPGFGGSDPAAGIIRRRPGGDRAGPIRGGEAAPAEDAEETEEAAPADSPAGTGSGDCWRGNGDGAGSGGNGEL